MPTLGEYRRAFSVEVGPYIGPEMYEVRAMGGSTTTQLFCHAFPVQSGIPQQDALIDRPLYRPTAVQVSDRNRYVKHYDPSQGLIEPDLEWTLPPISTAGATKYEELEAFMYYDLDTFTYEQLENTDLDGIGERFEVLGPFDVPTTHHILNDALKQCWLIVDLIATPIEGVTRFDLEMIAPWLQDSTDVLQVGVLGPDDDPSMVDPYARHIRGRVEQDGDRFYLNTMGRSFLASERLYLKCLKRAYDHCRVAGGVWGGRQGLDAESDEAPCERDWVTSSGLVIAWRRYAHMLEPMANQRLIRDQAMAAAWFSDRCREHFSAPLPARTLKERRHFGPPSLAGTG